jgi:hypothetical protein
LLAQFEGDARVAQSIIDLAWTLGEPYLVACEHGQPIGRVSEVYQKAVASIRQLGRDS